MSAPQKTIDLMDALRKSLGVGQGRGERAEYPSPAGSAPFDPAFPAALPPAFPRSEDRLTLDYLSAYRVDCQRLMARWVDRVLADLPAEKADLAHGIVYQSAKAELERPLRTAEYRLLSETTRDWINAHENKQAAEAGR